MDRRWRAPRLAPSSAITAARFASMSPRQVWSGQRRAASVAKGGDALRPHVVYREAKRCPTRSIDSAKISPQGQEGRDTTHAARRRSQHESRQAAICCGGNVGAACGKCFYAGRVSACRSDHKWRQALAGSCIHVGLSICVPNGLQRNCVQMGSHWQRT